MSDKIAILIFCVLIVIAAFLVTVDEGRLSFLGYKLPSTCALRCIFSVRCAFCGMSRSICATAHLQFEQAFHLHLLGPPFFFFILLQIPYNIYALAVGPRSLHAKLTKANAAIFVILLAAIIVNWLVYPVGRLF